MARRRRRSRLRLLLVLMALACTSVLVVRQLATYEPPPPPVVTAVRAAQARRAIAEARRTIKEVAQAAREGKRVPFRVHMKDEELTSYMASDPRLKRRLATRGMRDARFRFEDDHVTVAGFMKYHGRDVYVTVSGKPVADAEGRIRLAEVSVKLGKLNVPMLAPKAQQALDDMFRSGETHIPADVTEITAQNGELTLLGTSRPQ